MFHQTIVHGHIGRLDELKTLATGSVVCNFSLCVNDRVKRGDQWLDEPVWYQVAAWGGTATAIVNNKKVGDELVVIGKMRYDVEKDANGAVVQGGKTWWKLNAQNVDFCGRGNGVQEQSQEGAPEPVVVSSSDDIPF